MQEIPQALQHLLLSDTCITGCFIHFVGSSTDAFEALDANSSGERDSIKRWRLGDCWRDMLVLRWFESICYYSII